MGLCLDGRADTALVFNEVHYHPASEEPVREWIEFYNQMAVDLDVSGWRLTGDVEFVFPEGTRIQGQSYIVVALDPPTIMASAGLSQVLGPFSGRLSNSGGTLTLLNPDGRRMDRVRFGTDVPWPVTPDGAGPTLAKKDRDWASEAPDHWSASEQIDGTPGRENFPSAGWTAPSVRFNELSGATNTAFWVELANFGATGVDLGDWVIRIAGSTNAEAVVPPGLVVAAGGFVARDAGGLGFLPVAGDRLFLLTPDRARVVDGVVVKGRLTGRHPDGAGTWLYPSEPTPGGSNRFLIRDEVVINEVLYRPSAAAAVSGEPVASQWIELYNRGDSVVDLGGWALEGGIAYRFAAGQRLGPGAYLVVAREAAVLRAQCPGIEIVGDWAGRLSHRSDEIVLVDGWGNPAAAVRYFDGGHWPGYADGGGSTLELRDLFADPMAAEAWAASDETGKSVWQTVSYRAVATFPSGTQPTQWNDFILGLLDAGECLVDDLEVVESPGATPVALVGNGDFEKGTTGWRLLGTHRNGRVIEDPAQPGNHVLHLVATGPQEHMHNHIETTLLNGRSVVNGREYQVSYRARWLAGNPRLNTRLYFNRLARTTVLSVPSSPGTPGARNSRFTDNLGPTFRGLEHQPVVPVAGVPVAVSVAIEDSRGVAASSVHWSVNGGAWNSKAMAADGQGVYRGTLPGATAGAIVQFYVEAVDAEGAVATSPAGGRASGALYVVKDAQADFSRGHNLRLILTPANRDLLHAFTNVMSNDELPATVIYDERRAYYDVGLRLKGSQRGRYSDTRVGFRVAFQPDDLYRGVHPVLMIDRSGAGDSTSNKQLEIVIKHLAVRSGGIAAIHADLGKVIAPRSAHSSSAIFAPRFEDEFIDTAFADGGDGSVYELELIYYPTTANAAGYKNPQPDGVLGVDLQDLGADAELYRYNFSLKNHRDADDYRPFQRLGRALSRDGAALDTQTQATMDVDAWLRAWALVTLCGVSDSYTFGNDHNLMLYCRPEDDRFVPFPVDMDFAFVRGATSSLVGDRNLSRMISLPGNLRVFYGHVLDLIGTTFNSGYLGSWVSHYNSFVPEQSYSFLTSYVQQRGNYAMATIQSQGGQAPFALAGSTPITTANNLVVLSGTAPVTLRSLRINGVDWPLTWSSINQWTARVPVDEPTTVLALEGVDWRGQPLPGAAASVPVQYTGPAVVPEGRVVFNEIMYRPAAADASYVELYNASPNVAFDLSGWRIDGLDFVFPAGSVLAGGQYLVLAADGGGFADAYPSSTPIPAAVFSGNLNDDGETLTLLKPAAGGGETLIDQVRYESGDPWPAAANGGGASLQLIDPARDNRVPANWAAVESTGTPVPRWVHVVAPGTASSSSLYLYLGSAGDLYLDDVWLVAGSVAEAGPNLLANGGFESPLALPWVVGSNHAGSGLSTDVVRSGASSLHLVASVGGTTRASSISQDVTPALVQGQPYTLSFWYRESTNGGPFTARLSLHGITVTVDPAPSQQVTFTPGAANSVLTPSPAFPTLWLNEIVPAAWDGMIDNRGEPEPWVELYNPGPASVSGEGLVLARSAADPSAWGFPADWSLGPGQFALVWLDGEPDESSGTELHAGFRPDPAPGRLLLMRSGGQGREVLDYADYGVTPGGQSWGSQVDGDPFVRSLLERVTPRASNANTGPPALVVINEWMAANTGASGIADPADQRYQDWFELYNADSRTIDLTGWHVSDTVTNQFKFRIPAGYLLPPGGHLLVWADEETDQNAPDQADLHVNFKLSQEGEAIVLTRPDGTIADSVQFGPQTDAVSQGRSPDGAATIEFLAAPTPRGPNAAPPASPRIVAFAVGDDGAVMLTVETQPGRAYRLEFAEDVASGFWLEDQPSQTAAGVVIEFRTSPAASGQRFYRVVRLP